MLSVTKVNNTILFKTPPVLSVKKGRYLTIDSLRGLAIAGIFVYHAIYKFNYPSSFTSTQPILQSLDVFTERAAYYLLFGKMFGIFSLFFGFTFQPQNKDIKGVKKIRIVWRMIILLVFGCVNSLFLPMGDILVLYSLIGIAMTPFFSLRTPVLFMVAIILLAQPFELYRAFSINASHQYNTVFENFSILETSIKKALLSGNMFQIIKTNFLKGILCSLQWDFLSGRITQVTGLFILGIVAARVGLFYTSLYNRRFWQKLTLFFLSAVLVLWLLRKFLLPANGVVTNENINIALGLWINTAATLLIISGFTFLYYLNRGRVFHPLSYLGKMSLTNYVFQSFVGAFLFSSYGLNLGNRIGAFYAAIIAIAFFSAQIFFSRAWLKKHQKGPLESFWFFLTWIDGRKRVTTISDKINSRI